MTLTPDTFHHAAHIKKSANDTRDYAYRELDNGLKLLVISDKDAQRSAAAVDVGVGSASDPDDFLGLAHFLEHMLFLGTDKYPDPDDYLNYISEHGGNHNAFTAFDHTNYFFDIDPQYLHEGLKRFSRFFVAPLMAEKYVERERNAVDSEYQSKLLEDPWRGMDALKAAVNPKHPYARFNIGRLDTLPGDRVREALIAFYQQHYSADRMSAVIIGREDSETLLQWGQTLFADVAQRETTACDITEKLFDGVDLPIRISNQSIKKEKNLSVYFQFPYQLDNEYSKSLGYLSYILGYEGQGSLLESLKQLGYASELYSGAGYRIGNETSFEIGVQLTDKGYQFTQAVLAVIFAYLDLFKNDTNGATRYQEIATVAETAFRFKEKGNAIHEVSGLSTRLNRYPVVDVQALNATFSGYNAVQISDYLSLMTPEQAVVQLTAPDIESAQQTTYFSVPYTIEKLSPSALTQVKDSDKKIVDAMHLPNANPFIADDYRLQVSPESAVTEQHQRLASGVELFFKNDTSFAVPRVSVQVSLQPAMTLDISDKTVMSLLALLLDEQLTTMLYDASIAGVNAEITAGEKSIALSFEGYQQKIPDLLTAVLQQLNTLVVDAPTFARVKNTYRQDLQNAAAKMPYQQTFAYLNQALVVDASLPQERLEALATIDAQTLQTAADRLVSSLAVCMMVYGNSTFETATDLAQTIANTLSNSQLDNPWQANRATCLTDSVETTFAVNHSDHAVSYYLSAGQGFSGRAEAGLLAKMLEPQFFTQLRTEKQLGYIVFAYPRPTFNQAGIGFTVQSPVANAEELMAYIRDFNATFSTQLSALSIGEFNDVKAILQSELLQKPENLMSAASLYWSDILTTDSTESSRQAIAAAVEALELSTFVENAQRILQATNHVTINAVPALKK